MSESYFLPPARVRWRISCVNQDGIIAAVILSLQVDSMVLSTPVCTNYQLTRDGIFHARKLGRMPWRLGRTNEPQLL